jgi:hypothetical protein
LRLELDVENEVARKTFEPMKEEEIFWRASYVTLKTTSLRLAGHVTRMKEMRNTFSRLVQKPERARLL